MNTETFLELLSKSGLVTDDQADDALALIEAVATKEQFRDGEFIGKAFVERGMITQWHLRQLLKRRYKGFFIRQYKILGILGAGGMSTVYLAEHKLMQRRVAIKVLPKERLKKSGYLDHFVREAQVIATLDHPNIIRAYDIDREDDVNYIVMEFFDGLNLQKKADTEGPLAIPAIVLYILKTAKALAYAHKVGIIHRDIKPANILVDSHDQVKLLDLGLAMIDDRLYSGNLSSNYKESSILGTADYLAPEQAINSRNIDARADIYGLGGVLYFCLTGHSPFPNGSISERLLAHQQKEPGSILKDRANTPKDLVDICMKMMSKNPDNRQQTADEVV
ncbi:MAG: serine/threonine protein kinase, partial [Thermoguttaceae bacterium]